MPEKSVIIIGGGLVGSLCACFMAKRGFNVELYEKREDIRFAKEVKGRSINLNLVHRGRKALKSIGIENEILNVSIPMRGRLLHDVNGKLTYIPYDSIFSQYGYSISRVYLNKKLLDAAESYPKVKLFFQHKLVQCKFDEGSVILKDLKGSTNVEKHADLIIGADGAYSVLRSHMQKYQIFQYSQQYIEHGYMELNIEPKLGAKMHPNSLHIWPRGEFMMIALPNFNNSWTLTLFMPFKKFNTFKTGDDILEFFEREFKDAVSLLGKEKIREKINQKLLPLISVKCNPFHAAGKFLLIGDAAHAVVPFYGQGMNAGFEDCTILNQILDETMDCIESAIEKFSEIRVKNVHAISDLSMSHYVVMRDLVNKKSFKLRQKFDDMLFKLFPNVWMPLYWSIAFSSMDYAKCVESKIWQDKVLTGLLIGLSVLAILFIHFYLNI